MPENGPATETHGGDDSTPVDVSTKQERIAYRAKTHPQEAFVSLGHNLTREWLETAYHRTRKDGAVGIDGVSASKYAEKLDENLDRLSELARSGKYKAPPVKRGYVPKPGKKEVRPIGIPGFEDKVLQRGVAMLLEPIYEQDFLDCSYGFRPGRSPHQALEALWQNVQGMDGCWLLDVDVRKFFDTLDPQHLRDILDRRVRDVLPKRFARFGLTIHPGKTRLVDFRAPYRHPEGRPGTFDFLGFTHFWGKGRRGTPVVQRKTAKDRVARTLKGIGQWCKHNRHEGMPAQHRKLNQKLNGHYAYFGIIGNYRNLNRIYQQTRRLWYKWLKRRTRGGQGMDWERFGVLEKTLFPLARPRIIHSYK